VSVRFAIVGPTGAGKTALALSLADSHAVEVLSLDSVQVYRGLDIGSAKPTPDERARLPHHLVDLVEPTERFTAADWLARCEPAIADVVGRGKIPLLVGGTGLYLRLFTTGLAELPEADDALRGQLIADEAGTPGALHARLREIDAESAARIAPRDLVRLVRALEVHALTGRPLSSHLQAHAAARAEQSLPILLLDPPDDVLRAALVTRTQGMVHAGLVEEARALREKHGAVRPLEAVGYQQALELVDGAFAAAELVPRITTASWQFARRQRTWFRKAPGVVRYEDASQLLADARARLG
jgi:tRNA dimethylallyltransferase